MNLIKEHFINFTGVVEHSFLILILNNHVPGYDKVFQIYLGRTIRTSYELDNCLFIYLFIFLFICLFIYLFIYSFIYFLIYLCMQSFIY